jgi:hypothetical protein
MRKKCKTKEPLKKRQKAEQAPKAKTDTDRELEKGITKAVQAVEKVLAKVPEEKQEKFKAEVANTVRNLA